MIDQQISAIRKLGTVLKELSPQEKLRVLNFVTDSVREEMCIQQSGLGMAKQPPTQTQQPSLNGV